jgi:periplasmic divalent cation tolerance protein
MTRSPSDYVIVITTCPTQAEATSAAAALIEKRLAACVQANPITSTYRWQGAVEIAEEIRLLIKARSADYDAIEALLKATLSYENPEILAIPVTCGSRLYFDWIDLETSRHF